MYCDFFGLHCLPFADRADARFFYATEACQEILAAMKHEARHGEGMARIFGGPGIGKTALLRAYVLQSHSADRMVVLTWPACGEMRLVREVCKRFGVTTPSPYNGARALARLKRHLWRARRAGHRSTLIIDQAENLTVGNLRGLTALMELRHKGDKLLTVFLVGQPGFRSLLEKPTSIRSHRGIPTALTLSPLTLEEMGAYIRHRLGIAGADDVGLFDQEATAMIHQASQGIPRAINQLCDTAMIVAYGVGEARIGREIAAEVAEQDAPAEPPPDAQQLGAGSTPEAARPLPGVPPEQDAGESRCSMSAPPSACASQEPDGEGAELGEALRALPARHDEGFEGAYSNGRRSEASAGRLDDLYADGVALIERFERRLARADQRMQNLLDEVERRAERVETQMSHAPEATDEARQQLTLLEQACRRGGAVESNLASFAEELADKADTVQQRITTLASMLDMGEGVQQKVEALLHQMSVATSDAEARTKAVRSSLQETIDDAERCRQQFTDSALDGYQEKLRERVEAMTAAGRQSVDDALAACERSQAVLIERAQRETAEAQARVEDASALIGKLERGIEQARPVVGKLHHTESVIAAVEQACERASSVQSNLSVFAKHLVEKAEAVQEQITLLMSTLDTSEGVQREIEAMLHRASETTSHADGRMEALRGELEETVDEARDRCRQSVDATLEDGQERLQRQLVDFERSQRNVLESTQSEVQKTLDQASTALAQAQAAISSAGPLRDEVQHLVAGLESKLGRLDSQNIAAGNMLDKLSEASVAGRGVIEKANETTRAAEQAVQQVAEKTERLSQDVQELTERAEAGIEKFANSRAGGESLIQEIEAVLDRASQATSHADGRMETLRGELEEAVDDARRRCRQSLDATLEDWQRKLQGQLEEFEQAQRNVMESAQSEVHKTLDQASTALAQAERAVSAVEPLRDEVQRLKAGLEGKIGQLDSHSAAAKHVLHELSEANVTGRGVIEKATQATQAAEQAIEKTTGQVDRLLQDVGRLTAQAEAGAEKLADSRIEGESLILEIEAVGQPARGVVEQLAGQMKEGKQLTEQMAQRSSLAGKLVDRLASVAPLLRDAKEAQGSIKATLNEARAVYDDVSASVREAGQRVTKLDDLGATADNVLERHAQLKQETQRLCEQLAEQARSAQASAEGGKYLLAEFTEQGHGLAAKLHELRVQATQVEEAVAQAMAKPAEMLADAQAQAAQVQADSRAQAAQLEQLCATVRRVFGALSKASTEAGQHAEECSRASGEATERLATLHCDTERVSTGLHQSIDEAVRVQARLKRTLERAESIPEMPSGDTVRTLPHTRQPAVGIAAARVSGELEVLSEPRTRGESEREPPTGPRTRAEEVSQLIKDAKRAPAVRP